MPRAAKRSSALKAIEAGPENRSGQRMLSWAPTRPIAPVGRSEPDSPAARREAAASTTGQGATSPAARREAAGPARAAAMSGRREPPPPGTPRSAPPLKGQTGPRPGY